DGSTKQRRDLVADEAVEHAPRLLRVDEVLVNLFRLLESLLHRALRDLVEHHAEVWLPGALRDDLLGDVQADGLALAVGAGSELDGLGLAGGALQLGDGL